MSLGAEAATVDPVSKYLTYLKIAQPLIPALHRDGSTVRGVHLVREVECGRLASSNGRSTES
jgi:hypothetical protein